MFRAVGGRNPGSTNTYDNGTPKMIYVINIEKLVASAEDGTVDCSIDSGRELGQGHGDEADCPTLAGVITVDDNTTGGPHWAALDNFNFTPSGAPTRMMFCDYFVARTGYDGNHRCYMLNVDPDIRRPELRHGVPGREQRCARHRLQPGRLAGPQGRRVLQAALDGVRHPRGGRRLSNFRSVLHGEGGRPQCQGDEGDSPTVTATISRARPRRYAVAVSAFLALFLRMCALWAAPPAWGHPYLVQTEPGPGVALPNTPPRVQIGFTEPVVLEGSSLRLDDSEGRPVALGPLGVAQGRPRAGRRRQGPARRGRLPGPLGRPLGGRPQLVGGVPLRRERAQQRPTQERRAVDRHRRPRRPAGAIGRADPHRSALARPLRRFAARRRRRPAGPAEGRLDDEVAGVLAARWTPVARLGLVLTLPGAIAAVVAAAGAGAGGAQLSVLLATSTGTVALARLAGRGRRRPPRPARPPRPPARPVPRDGRGLLPRGRGGRRSHHGAHVVVAVPGHRGPGRPSGRRRHVGRRPGRTGLRPGRRRRSRPYRRPGGPPPPPSARWRRSPPRS